MRKTFQVPPNELEIIHNPDVCVIGGGASGLSAAVGASRCGLKTLLIEKYGFCGGATVAGLSGTICGLHSSGDNPEQIVFGFADEFHQILKTRGGVKNPLPFGRTRLVPHDSFIWKQAADHIGPDVPLKGQVYVPAWPQQIPCIAWLKPLVWH